MALMSARVSAESFARRYSIRERQEEAHADDRGKFAKCRASSFRIPLKLKPPDNGLSHSRQADSGWICVLVSNAKPN